MGVRDIPLILQFPQVIASCLQILNIDIAPAITDVLSDGGCCCYR